MNFKINTEYLFVYGTLLNDSKNSILHGISDNLKFGDYGYASGELYDLGEYPALIPALSATAQVRGEVYIVTDSKKVFGVLDEYEGVYDEPCLYSREQKAVTLAAGGQIKCWMYIYRQLLGDNCIKIDDGDYTAFIKNKLT